MSQVRVPQGEPNSKNPILGLGFLLSDPSVFSFLLKWYNAYLDALSLGKVIVISPKYPFIGWCLQTISIQRTMVVIAFTTKDNNLIGTTKRAHYD